MPLQKVKLSPGFNQQATPTLNEGGFSFGNLVRFRYGLIQKIAGWAQLFSAKIAGKARALHAWENLSPSLDLMIGTDNGAQVYEAGVLYPPFIFNLSSTNGATLFSNGTTTILVTDPNQPNVPTGAQVQFVMTTLLSWAANNYLLAGGFTAVATNVNTTQYTVQFPVPIGATMTALTPQFIGPLNALVTANAPVPNRVCVFLPGAWNVVFTLNPITLGAIFNVEVATTLSDGTVLIGPYTVTKLLGNSGDTNCFQISASCNGAVIGSNVAYENGSLNNLRINYPATIVPSSPQNWFLDNFGQDGLISYTNGKIYQYTPPISLPPAVQQLAGAPTISAGMFVAMPQAQVVSFGSEVVINGGVQDPLLVRWSDAGNQNVWIASTTNQAGSYRLSRGSKIVGGVQAPQSTFLWTDVDLWSMAYIGFPLVYSFTVVASGCGLISALAYTVQGPSIYWMSQKQFWSMTGQGVEVLECPLWDYVFPDLDQANAFKCFAASNSTAKEIMFFFPSISGGTGECDSYVKYHTLEQVWDPGRLVRTAWIDQSVFGGPLGADLNLLIQEHEVGYDANGAAMSGVYFETGFFDLGDGDVIPFIKDMIPDMKWLGAADGYVTVTLWGANDPGEAGEPTAPTMYGPWTVTSGTNEITLDDGVRKRQIALRIDWGPVLGFGATLGAPRFRISPAGKRP